jgi:hypothetical protein
MTQEQDGSEDIRSWAKTLRNQTTDEEYKNELHSRFDSSTGAEEKYDLYFCLDEYYARKNDIEAQRQLQIQMLAFDPSNYSSWVSLSGFELCWNNFRTALAAAERAVLLCKEQKSWQRYALGTKARALHSLEKYTELDSCLLEIAHLLPKEDEPDCPPEVDFFRNLDKSRISSSTAAIYQAYLDRWKGKTHPAWGGMVGQ